MINLKNKYDNKSRLLFRATDSLMYEIKTEDVYEDFSNDKEMSDFSNCSTKLKYYDDSNKLVIGKTIVNSKKEKVWIEMLLQQQVIMSVTMYCWIIHVWDIQWIEFKVKTIK